MKNKLPYPTAHDIGVIVSENTNFSWAREFAASRGIFIPTIKKKTIGSQLANFFWDNDDLSEIQDEAYQQKHTSSLSGFTVKPEDGKDLPTIITEIKQNGSAKGIIDKIDMPYKQKGTEGIYVSRIEYTLKKLGRLEFLREEKFDFDFYMIKRPQGDWRVEIDSKRSKDLTITKDVFRKHEDLKKNIEIADVNKLKVKSSISMFNSLKTNGLPSDWKFKDVVELTIKRKRTDSEDDEEAPEEMRTGIRQAILAGTGLETDPFVIQAEKDGFMFTSMTYLFEHKTRGLNIQIKAEFKGNPKALEVSLVKSLAVFKGEGAAIQPVSLKPDIVLKLKTTFWNNALKIYNKALTE